MAGRNHDVRDHADGLTGERLASPTWTTRRLVLAVAIALGIVVVQVGWRAPTAGPATYAPGATRSASHTSGPFHPNWAGAAPATDQLDDTDLARHLPTPLARDIVHLRDAPSRNVADPRDAAIVAGVAFGRTDGIDPGDKQDFLTSGLWHLLRWVSNGQNAISRE